MTVDTAALQHTITSPYSRTTFSSHTKLAIRCDGSVSIQKHTFNITTQS